MKKWLLLLLPAMVLCAASPDAQTEKDIRGALNAYKQAMMKKDATALAKVLHEDLAYTHSSNQHQNKAEVIASLKEPTIIENIDFKNPVIHVYGNTALVKGDVDFHSNRAGTKTVSKLNVLHVLVKGAQGWQLVARQATRYPEPTPATK